MAREAHIDDVLVYSLYNGFRRLRGLSESRGSYGLDMLVRRRLTFREALLPVRALAHYRSQRRTWLGLGPGLTVRALVGRDSDFGVPSPAGCSSTAPRTAPLRAHAHVPARSVLDATAALREELATARRP